VCHKPSDLYEHRTTNLNGHWRSALPSVRLGRSGEMATGLGQEAWFGLQASSKHGHEIGGLTDGLCPRVVVVEWELFEPLQWRPPACG
jgi:hypothetical protein